MTRHVVVPKMTRAWGVEWAAYCMEKADAPCRSYCPTCGTRGACGQPGHEETFHLPECVDVTAVLHAGIDESYVGITTEPRTGEIAIEWMDGSSVGWWYADEERPVRRWVDRVMAIPGLVGVAAGVGAVIVLGVAGWLR